MNVAAHLQRRGFETTRLPYDGGAFVALARPAASDDAATLVLLHGAAGNAAGWLPLVDGLGDLGLLLVDLPGHGASPAVEDWNLEPLADALHEAIHGRCSQPLFWDGHSWGGKTAAILAARHPEAVRGLVLVDPSPASPVPVTPEDFVDTVLGGELGSWPDDAAAATDARALPHFAAWSDDLACAFSRGLTPNEPGPGLRTRVTRGQLIEIARIALTLDHAPAISKVAAPTLLLMAGESMFWQQFTNVPALPAAKNVVLEGQHWIHWQRPEEVAAAMRNWVGDCVANA